MIAACLMFRITPNPTFSSPVSLSLPGSDVGQVLQVTWRHKRKREIGAALEGNVTEFLRSVIESWSGIVDEHDKPVPYSVEALDILLDAYPSSGAELIQAYMRQIADARAKN